MLLGSGSTTSNVEQPETEEAEQLPGLEEKKKEGEEEPRRRKTRREKKDREVVDEHRGSVRICGVAHLWINLDNH